MTSARILTIDFQSNNFSGVVYGAKHSLGLENLGLPPARFLLKSTWY